MRLTLTRLERNRTTTIGELETDDGWKCWTLEDTVRPHGQKVPGATAIPAGVYPVQITWSPRFKQQMPLLIGVPNFTGVRIHPGNTSEDTEGCILVGFDRDGDSIGRSRLAYQDLYAQIQDAIDSAESVTIEILNRFEEA